MADKVYIPNLVVNEISEDLIDEVANKVGGKVTVDTSNLAKLDSNNTFKGALIVANNNANQELAITPIANGVSINLGDDCTLTMSAKMISELKRLLGIQ